MVLKQVDPDEVEKARFRAVLFRMVSKQDATANGNANSFRAVLFRMVSKQK